jgi:hypothetical protein
MVRFRQRARACARGGTTNNQLPHAGAAKLLRYLADSYDHLRTGNHAGLCLISLPDSLEELGDRLGWRALPPTTLKVQGRTG